MPNVGQKASRTLTLTAEHVRKYSEITGDLSHRVDIPYLPGAAARDLRDLIALRAGSTGFQV